MVASLWSLAEGMRPGKKKTEKRKNKNRDSRKN